MDISCKICYTCEKENRQEVEKMSEQKKPPLTKSFGYAFEGIFTGIRKERNMKIHCTVAALVMIAGLILRISPVEWCICLGLFGLVMALEAEKWLPAFLSFTMNTREGSAQAMPNSKPSQSGISR